MDFVESIKRQFELEDKDIKSYSPLTLAYIGDGVYELVIRTIIVAEGNAPVNKLHRRATQLVKAGTQAAMIKIFVDELDDEELTIYKRGRNAKSATVAKNAKLIDYRMATGFEALMGYLYIEGRYDRMMELIKKGIDGMEKEN